MTDTQRRLGHLLVDRRRLLRSVGIVGLAVAGAGVLTGCPVASDDDDGDDDGDDGGDDDGDDDDGGGGDDKDD